MKAVGALNLIAGSLVALIGGFVIVWSIGLLTAVSSQQVGVLLVLVLCLGVGIYLVRGGLHRVRTGTASLKVSSPVGSNRGVEDRLDQLERLKRRDMVTLEEYAAKRQEILKDL